MNYDALPATLEPACEEIAKTAEVIPAPAATAVLTPVPAAEPVKTESRIKTAKKRTEAEKLKGKALEYYEKNEYGKAIEVFSELIKVDASYRGFRQYSDSFLQLAREHNLAGVKQYNEGRLEQAVKEFDNALNMLETMKSNTSNYDMELYSKLKELFAGNKDRMLEKAEKIDACFKLANECNLAGVKYYNEGSFKKAKLEFENAIKHLSEIRLLVSKYSGNSYESLMEIYKGNLSRTEERL